LPAAIDADFCIRNLRAQFAPTPIAAPAASAPSSGPELAPEPKLNALPSELPRLRSLRRSKLLLSLVSLRVASICSPVGLDCGLQPMGERRRSCCEQLSSRVIAR
jgi:hypothetical protein